MQTGPSTRLGVDSYSLRWQGWDAFQMLDYGAQVGLDLIQFSERGNFASLDSDYLTQVRQRADELGLAIEVGMGSFDRLAASFRPELGTGPEQLIQMVRAAQVVGSPVVRCFLGSQVDRLGPTPMDQHLEECRQTLRTVADVTRDAGVKIAVENHGGVDLLARELRELVVAAGPDYVGVCLDTGNPAYAGEDPVVSTEILAPYTVTSHVRDTAIWATPTGAMAQWAPMGRGSVDLPRIIAILREQAPQAPIDLEIITGAEPQALPYWEPEGEFWQMYPNMLAQDFARFVTLAQGSRVGLLDQETLPPGVRMPPPERAEALRAQQRRHFEESVRYSREVLGIGVRGR